MKKLLLGMFAAGMLFTTSCSSDEFNAPAGEEAVVSFSLNLDGSNATRAISDASKVDVVYYEVYNEAGDVVLEGEAQVAGKEATLNIPLVKGQVYDFAFWAQHKAYVGYDVKSLEDVRVNYEKVTANDELRDAFFGQRIDLEVEGPINETVTLKRPFAQVNFAVGDLEAFKAQGFELEQTKVVVSEVFGALNALTGEASGAIADVEFSLADVALIGEKLSADVNGDGVAEEYDWLAMNYLLPAGNATVEFTFTTNNRDVVIKSDNTPLQANWRTNIIGNLTQVSKFNIVLDQNYESESSNGVNYGVLDESTGKLYKGLDDAIADGVDNIRLVAGEYTLGTDVKTADLKITGVSAADVKISYAKTVNMSGVEATFENVTLVTPNTNYTGFQHAGNVTFNGCNFENTYWCYNEGDTKTTFNNCTFNHTDAELYNVWTYASNVDFNNCVFNCAGKSVLVYAENSTEWKTVNFKDCKFYASAPVDGKAAIEIDSSLHPYNVSIENCTAEGFGKGSKSGNSLFNLKNGEEGVNCNLYVVLADGVKLNAGVYEISNANGMFWFANEVNVNGNTFSGKTVKLTADIDLNNKLWAPVGQTGATQFLGTFDGQNYTISNLHVDTDLSDYGFQSAGLFGWIEAAGVVSVKNVKIEKADVKGHHNVAVIAGYLIGTVDNCHVTGATLSCTHKDSDLDGDKCGVIVGNVATKDSFVTNCSATDCAVSAGRDAGQIAGSCIVGKVEGCSATNVTVESNGTSTGKNIRNELIGRIE